LSVICVRDVVGFHGTTVDELETAFREAVDDYLAACKKLGQDPDKAASGKFVVRATPELHREALAFCAAQGKSLNAWACEILSEALRATWQAHTEIATLNERTEAEVRDRLLKVLKCLEPERRKQSAPKVSGHKSSAPKRGAARRMVA
jgi:predicted HicB family RNase H-like nuclease